MTELLSAISGRGILQFSQIYLCEDKVYHLLLVTPWKSAVYDKGIRNFTWSLAHSTGLDLGNKNGGNISDFVS